MKYDNNIEPDIDLNFDDSFDLEEMLTNSVNEQEDNEDEYYQPDDLEEVEIENSNSEENTRKEDEEEKLTDEDLENIISNEDEEASDSNKDNEENDTDPYSLAFKFITEQNILHVPDNFNKDDLTEESILKLVEENHQIRNQQVFEAIKNQSEDPRLQELFDVVWNGGTYEDLQDMRVALDAEFDWESADPSNEEHAKIMIKQLMLEGLDENNPAHQIKIKNIDSDIQNSIDNMESEQLAKQSKQYFLERIRNEKERVKNNKQQRVLEQQRIEQQRIERQNAWNSTFQEKLSERNWSSEKKNEVLEQMFYIVELDNGQEMKLWEYKMNQIWNNPEHAHMLMDFLSDFDEYKLEFKTRKESSNTKVANTFVKNLINKTSGNKGSKKRPAQKNNTKKKAYYDAMKNRYN